MIEQGVYGQVSVEACSICKSVHGLILKYVNWIVTWLYEDIAACFLGEGSRVFFQ